MLKLFILINLESIKACVLKVYFDYRFHILLAVHVECGSNLLAVI